MQAKFLGLFIDLSCFFFLLEDLANSKAQLDESFSVDSSVESEVVRKLRKE